MCDKALHRPRALGREGLRRIRDAWNQFGQRWLTFEATGFKAKGYKCQHTQQSLDRYVLLAQRLGFASASYLHVGADVVDEAEQLCIEIARRYPHLTIFTGQLIFQRDTWYQRLLHNFTAFALQRRLQWRGLSMVILPTRVDLNRAVARELVAGGPAIKAPVIENAKSEQ